MLGGPCCTPLTSTMRSAEKACEREWPEMEALINIHSEERMFVGGRTSVSDQYYKRFSVCLGLSVTTFHGNERSRGTMSSKRGQRTLLGVSPVSRLLNHGFCKKGGEPDPDLEQVERYMNDTFESATDWGRIERSQLTLMAKKSSKSRSGGGGPAKRSTRRLRASRS